MPRKKSSRPKNKECLQSTQEKIKVKKKPVVKKEPKAKIEKPYNNGTFSTTAFWNFIKSALRKQSMYWKPIQQCRLNARRPYTGTNTRMKWEYKCNVCGDYIEGKNSQIDHIQPVGSLRSAEDLAGVISRLFVEIDGLQCICTPCHNKKSIIDIANIKQENLIKDGKL